jgi:hypothetical protein
MGREDQWRLKAREAERLDIFRILEAQESYRLEAFYCTLDAAGRRRRFGAGVSDGAIRSHCETLAAKGAIVVGAFQVNRMDAAVEIVPYSSAWEQAEIVVASRPNARARTLVSALVRLAAKAARRKGCLLLVAVHDGDPAALPLLAAIGDVELDGDLAWTDIFDSRLAAYSPAIQGHNALEPAAFEA